MLSKLSGVLCVSVLTVGLLPEVNWAQPGPRQTLGLLDS
jgi:hypothetical protein